MLFPSKKLIYVFLYEINIFETFFKCPQLTAAINYEVDNVHCIEREDEGGGPKDIKPWQLWWLESQRLASNFSVSFRSLL